MKTFEHEVLTFTASTKKDIASMKVALREWGASGFEIISVLQTNSTTPITVFLKRETSEEIFEQGEAA